MRPAQRQRLLRLAVLFSWFGCLFFLLLSRTYLTYVRATYAPVLALGLVILAAMVVRRRADEKAPGVSAATALLFVYPLLLALAVRPGTLTSAAAVNRGISTSFSPADASAVEQLLSRVETEGNYRRMNLKQLLSLTTADPEKAKGLSVAVEGLVFKDARGSQDGFTLVRFLITCCAADATPLGVRVLWKDAPLVPQNVWVVVRGTVSIEGDGARIAADEVMPVPMPSNPYLY